MDENELYHHGIKGQKWGVKNGPPYPLSNSFLAKAKRKINSLLNKKEQSSDSKKKTSSSSSSGKKKISDMSDSELQSAINRLNLEKRYSELVSDANVKNMSAGRKFANAFCKSAGKAANKMTEQVLSATMAKAINKIAGEEIVFANNKKKS